MRKKALPGRRLRARRLEDLLTARDVPDLTARVLGVAADLVEAVPCFDLSFRLDPGFWEVIDGD